MANRAIRLLLSSTRELFGKHHVRDGSRDGPSGQRIVNFRKDLVFELDELKILDGRDDMPKKGEGQLLLRLRGRNSGPLCGPRRLFTRR